MIPQNPETQLIESAISVAVALRRLGAAVPTGDQERIQEALSDLGEAHSALLMADDAYHRATDDCRTIAKMLITHINDAMKEAEDLATQADAGWSILAEDLSAILARADDLSRNLEE